MPSSNIKFSSLSRYLVATALMLATLNACSFDSLVNVDDPESGRELSPGAISSREGGLGLYRSAVGQLAQGISELSRQVGAFTDELAVRPASSDDHNGMNWPDDSRLDSTNRWGERMLASSSYAYLHGARVRASQARTVLSKFDDPSYNYILAATYGVEAYSIILLAESMCSGIPLSEVPFGLDVEFTGAIPTEQLFTTAIAKLDSGLFLEQDSARVTALLRMGKARAYMGLGDYEQAAEVVADYSETDKFELTYTLASPYGSPTSTYGFWADTVLDINRGNYNLFEMVNREGRNGIVWYQDPNKIDPRLPVTLTEVEGVAQFATVVRQRKRMVGNMPFPLAHWVEAKMILAENYLSKADPQWLTELNSARRSVGLSDTTDPGTSSARVDLLFRERAFWFYLDGRRLADYRRLINQYGRSIATVYPVGVYTRRPGVPFYGEAYVFSPPSSEYEHNYKYDGCIHRNP